MKLHLILILACLMSSTCKASDQNREQDYADAVVKTLTTGNIVWLQAENIKFLSIYTESEYPESLGVAIILHDKGGHPDQKPLIQSLRTILPQHRYATLSVQMPLREFGAPDKDYYALFPEAKARLEASVEYLRTIDIDNVVLIGYGLGGLMALSAQNKLNDAFNAVVAISLPVPKSKDQEEQTLAYIKQIKVPFLDLYGSLDVPQVTNTARKRRLAAKENPAYRQINIANEGHLYWHDEGLIVKRVYSWLRRVLQ